MNQSLSRRTQSLIIAIILLLHGSMLLMLFIAQMQQADFRHEAIVMVDPDEFLPMQNKTEVDWVAMQSVPQVQAPKLDPIPPASLDAFPAPAAQVAQPKNPALDKKIDQAMAIAEQLLKEPEKKQAITKAEQS